MAIGYNHVTLIGNLGKEPQVTAGETLRVSFSLAVDRVRTDDSGERREETDWFTIVAWGRVAEICRDYLSKGSLVLISGRLQTRRWQDHKQKWYNITEVVAREVVMLNTREQDESPDEHS